MPRHLFAKWKNNIFGIKPYLFSLIEFGRIFSLQFLFIFYCLTQNSIINFLAQPCLPNLPPPYIMLLSTRTTSSFPQMLFSQLRIPFHLPLSISNSRVRLFKVFSVPSLFLPHSQRRSPLLSTPVICWISLMTSHTYYVGCLAMWLHVSLKLEAC